ncbi:RDD family protein [Thermobifida halotolerans]|uniref:RDD family protein n=1 Tax=Thermobifida halotolerans TaxID=483545 RepID=A0AA97LZ20_9ACTN|nr:RDD family protein [Thermobifida halotolerans]UOE20626.1 RDD family protein [Thermobifida halotolerans]
MGTTPDVDLPVRRALATGVDYALLASAPALAWLLVGRRRAASAAVAAPAAGARLGVGLGLTLPAVAALAWAEARGATPGKRLLRLRVSDLSGRPPGYRRALTRLLAKTALPWELGHQAVWDFFGGAQARGTALAAAAYAAVGAQAVAAVRGSGRTYADLLAGTRVDRAERPEREAGEHTSR